MEASEASGVTQQVHVLTRYENSRRIRTVY